MTSRTTHAKMDSYDSNACYNLWFKKIRTLETYKGKSQEHNQTSFTTIKIRRMLGTTQRWGRKSLDMKIQEC